MTNTVSLDYAELPSGRFVSMRDPDPKDITVEDIAHKLAQINRYGGSTSHPYSVAQHAVFVAERLKRQGYSREIQLLGLHHDDPEFVLMDIPRPVKELFGQPYKDLTTRFEVAIRRALGLPRVRDDVKRIIKAADNYALLVEARMMMPSRGRRWDYLKELDGLPSRLIIPDYFMGEKSWRGARDSYLYRHDELTNA